MKIRGNQNSISHYPEPFLLLGGREAKTKTPAQGASSLQQEQVSLDWRSESGTENCHVCRRRLPLTIALEVLQERVVLIQHDHTIAIGHGAAIRLQTAVKRVERRVFGTGLAVDTRSLGIAFAA